jgi:hypothetical protein
LRWLFSLWSQSWTRKQMEILKERWRVFWNWNLTAYSVLKKKWLFIKTWKRKITFSITKTFYEKLKNTFYSKHTTLTQSSHSHCFVPIPSQEMDWIFNAIWQSLFSVQWFEVRGGCLFCWYWWNSLPSLFKKGFTKGVIKIHKSKKNRQHNG